MRKRSLALTAALLAVIATEWPADADPQPQQPPGIEMLAGSPTWVVYRLEDSTSGFGETLAVRAVDRSGRVIDLPLDYARSAPLSLVRGVLSAEAGTHDRVIWTDLGTGVAGEHRLRPHTAYLAGSADGWLTEGPDGLVDVSRSGGRHVIDPSPPPAHYLVSDRGFILQTEHRVTYRSWAHLQVRHVFRPHARDGESLACNDLSAKAIACSMDKNICPKQGCDDEPRVHHRPFFLPLPNGTPVRSPLVGVLLGRTITTTTVDNTTLRRDLETWHVATGTVTTAEPPADDYVEVIGRALGRLILQRYDFDGGTGQIDRLIAATPDLTGYEPIVCSPAPC